MTEHYRLNELAALVGATPRTIRFYIAEGLLPPPSGAGPATYYTEAHRDRLLLIEQLKGRYLALRDIREQLAGMTDDAVHAALSQATREQTTETSTQSVPTSRVATTAQRGDASGQPSAGEQWQRFVLSDGIEVHVRADRHREWVLLDTLIRQARTVLTDGEGEGDQERSRS